MINMKMPVEKTVNTWIRNVIVLYYYTIIPIRSSKYFLFPKFPVGPTRVSPVVTTSKFSVTEENKLR